MRRPEIMGDNNHKIQMFNGQKVRTAWNAEEEKWYFSIVDVCGVLTEQPDYNHTKYNSKRYAPRVRQGKTKLIRNHSIR